MSAGGSGIYFNIIGFPNTAKQIGLFISIGIDNNYGNDYSLSVGQIYMRYHDLQLGYATSLYNDRGADAYTIDGHGPCASGAHNAIGINWQHYINKHIHLGVAVELPDESYTQTIPQEWIETLGKPAALAAALERANKSYTYLPDFPVYVGYNWGSGHVRLSAVLRNIHYVDLVTDRSHSMNGGGLKITGKSTFGPVNLFWMLQGGQALASYFKDNENAGLDLVPKNNKQGLLQPTQSWGFITGMQYNFSPKLFATAQCSYLRNKIPHYEEGTRPFNDQMKHGFSAVGNVVWKISSLFSTGVEYRFGRRVSESNDALSNNRVYAMFQMTF